jgi:hypothetical protein
VALRLQPPKVSAPPASRRKQRDGGATQLDGWSRTEPPNELDKSPRIAGHRPRGNDGRGRRAQRGLQSRRWPRPEHGHRGSVPAQMPDGSVGAWRIIAEPVRIHRDGLVLVLATGATVELPVDHPRSATCSSCHPPTFSIDKAHNGSPLHSGELQHVLSTLTSLSLRGRRLTTVRSNVDLMRQLLESTSVYCPHYLSGIALALIHRSVVKQLQTRGT